MQDAPKGQGTRIGPQGEEVRGELVWKHGHLLVREVQGGFALLGLVVKKRVGRNEPSWVCAEKDRKRGARIKRSSVDT